MHGSTELLDEEAGNLKGEMIVRNSGPVFNNCCGPGKRTGALHPFPVLIFITPQWVLLSLSYGRGNEGLQRLVSSLGRPAKKVLFFFFF